MENEIVIGSIVNGQYEVIDFGVEGNPIIIAEDVETRETVILHDFEITHVSPPSTPEQQADTKERAEMNSKSKQELMAEELDALTEMMVRDSIIQDHLIAEEVESVQARLAAQKQEDGEKMSKFEVGDKVRWDDVMGHSEEGVIVETQFHHYVIGRMVDGELVAHGYVRFDEPTLRKQEEPAQVAYPLTSETMYGTPNGGTTICNACGVPVGYDGLVPPVLCYRCSQTESTTKVEALTENLKHLDKPGRRDNVCRSWVNGVAHLTDSFNYYRRTKATGGRNKAGGNFGRYDMRVERELDALIYDTRSSRFFEGDTVRTPRQSQAIRDGYCHWFPVALENTTYSDSLARHFSGGLQEGLRATESLLPRGDSWLYRKFNGRRYQDKLWVPREDWGNKAQVNRYHACKTY